MPKVRGVIKGKRVGDIRPYHIPRELELWYGQQGTWDRITGCRASTDKKGAFLVTVRLAGRIIHAWRMSGYCWDLTITELDGMSSRRTEYKGAVIYENRLSV